jgi:hypothetical protein
LRTDALTAVCGNVDAWPAEIVRWVVKVRGRLDHVSRIAERETNRGAARDRLRFLIPRCELY